MQKPLNTQLPADLPENWQLDQAVSPEGTDVGLTEKHGYNYLSKQINAAQEAINTVNEAFAGAQGNLEAITTDTSIADSDTVPVVKSDNTKRKVSFTNIVNAIKAKFNSVYAALVHSHGNITNDGKIGSTANLAVFTETDGKLKAGTLPVAAGGTGASTAAGARTNLGVTPANIGAAPTTHNHTKSQITDFPDTMPPSAHNHSTDDISSGILPIVRGGTGASSAAGARTALGITPGNIGAAPTSHSHSASDINAGTLPIARGGTGVTDLNTNKLQRGDNANPSWTIYLSPNGSDSNTGFSESAAMRSIRAAVGKYGGLNRLHLTLAPGTYTDSGVVEIAGNCYVNITGASTTAGAVVITHPIIFQSNDAKIYRVTFDLTASTSTYPGVTFRQAKYDIQECVFKGKAGVHAGINASLGSSGYIVSCNFQTGVRAVEVGAGALMSALTCSIASAFEIGFNVNGGTLLSGGNTNNAVTKFTMYNSAVIFEDGTMLNRAQSVVSTLAEATVI